MGEYFEDEIYDGSDNEDAMVDYLHRRFPGGVNTAWARAPMVATRGRDNSVQSIMQSAIGKVVLDENENELVACQNAEGVSPIGCSSCS